MLYSIWRCRLHTAYRRGVYDDVRFRLRRDRSSVAVRVVNLLTASALLWCAGLTFVARNILLGITCPSVVRSAP